jgi:hypothetical protein
MGYREGKKVFIVSPMNWWNDKKTISSFVPLITYVHEVVVVGDIQLL